MPDQHAEYAPSGMYPTVHCYGRHKFIADIPEEEESSDAMEGTAAHFICEQLFAGHTTDELLGTQAPNGVIITEEMCDSASVYYENILEVTDTPFIEQRVYMPQIHEHCWGTPDAWFFDVKTWTLHVWDFKYGHGSVIAYENYQLIAYFAGVLNIISKEEPTMEQSLNVDLRIVQPRCYDGLGAVRQWKVPAVELRNYVNKMHYACGMSDQIDQPVTSGSHCKYCVGRHLCPAALNSAAQAFDYSIAAIPHKLTNNGLGYELAVLDRAEDAIKYRKEALVAEAIARGRAGAMIPGYSMIQGYSRDKWLRPASEIISLGTLMGVELKKEDAPITPGQAKVLLKKNNVDACVIKDYYGKEPTSIKLKKDDGTKAKLAFSKEI